MAPDLQGQEPPFGPQPQLLTIPDPRSGTAMRAPTPTLDDPRPQKSGATVRATTHVHHTPQKQNIAPISRQPTRTNHRRSQKHHPVEKQNTARSHQPASTAFAKTPGPKHYPSSTLTAAHFHDHPQWVTVTTCPCLLGIAVQLTATTACAPDVHFA